MTLRIELDAIKKAKNASEWRYVNRARCGQYEADGDGKVIEQLCRIMAAAGVADDVEVWRGQTLCFPAIPVAIWAAGKVGKGKQPEHLARAVK